MLVLSSIKSSYDISRGIQVIGWYQRPQKAHRHGPGFGNTDDQVHALRLSIDKILFLSSTPK